MFSFELVRAISDIGDLSRFGLGVAQNGGGTDGEEYRFPAISVSAGDVVWVTRHESLVSYLGSSCIGNDSIQITDSAINQNGDDAIELFELGQVIETYGDANVVIISCE